MGAGGVNGIDMANIKNIDGFSVPPVSITLLADLDFTTMTSASWTGESTVSLNSQTWTIGNGSNAHELGPNGSLLIFHPKGTADGDWWEGTRTAPYLSIKLSALDDNLDASAQYVVQTVCNEHPATLHEYSRFMAGFWSDDGTDRGYSCLFGQADRDASGGPVSYFYLGGSSQCFCPTDEDELTFYSYLNPTGFNETRTSTSADGNTPAGGTFRGALYVSNASPGFVGEQGTLLLTASAPVNVGLIGVGRNASSDGPTYKVDRLRVWKLQPKI